MSPRVLEPALRSQAMHIVPRSRVAFTLVNTSLVLSNCAILVAYAMLVCGGIEAPDSGTRRSVKDGILVGTAKDIGLTFCSPCAIASPVTPGRDTHESAIMTIVVSCE